MNVSRGRIVDEGPLYRALSKGILTGAALDVRHRYPESFSENRLPSEYPFHTLENVVLSPRAGKQYPRGETGSVGRYPGKPEGAVSNRNA